MILEDRPVNRLHMGSLVQNLAPSTLTLQESLAGAMLGEDAFPISGDFAASIDSRGLFLAAELAIVVPTYNELENIDELIARVEVALEHVSWELIFVDDDSPDGTATRIAYWTRRDARIRLIRRIGRRGLSSACIEGILATSAPFVAVMDADLQHDEAILGRMLERIRSESLDVVVGTRNATGGSMGEFAAHRVHLSQFGRRLSRSICNCEISDPMSGFFMLRRDFFLDLVHRLYGGGFKILVDILASSRRPARLGEVGYSFRNRLHGESKLDANTALEYLFLILDKMSMGIIHSRFVAFSIVGLAGLVIHVGCLAFCLLVLHRPFAVAQTVATVLAVASNFFLNNLITYRDRRLQGMSILLGLLTFSLACCFGAWASVVFARALMGESWPWYFAGGGGVVLSSVWNYSVSNLVTWQRAKPEGRCVTQDTREAFKVTESTP